MQLKPYEGRTYCSKRERKFVKSNGNARKKAPVPKGCEEKAKEGGTEENLWLGGHLYTGLEEGFSSIFRVTSSPKGLVSATA